MYIPHSNRVSDPEKAFAFMAAYGFATLVTQCDGVPWASHLPVLLDRGVGKSGVLISHMAIANEQWRHFEAGKEVLCIFNGPHAYVSPSWYEAKIAVPTWNYAAVHVYGTPSIVEGREELLRIVSETTEKYEKGRPNPWTLQIPESTMDSLMKAIVGFSIAITRVEAKFKLGQNRSREDQDGMLRGLEESADAGARELAQFVRRERGMA
jgi:transcriptional regulator